MSIPLLGERLKVATHPFHVAAERAPLMQALLKGRLALGAYREMLLNLRAIYATLEREMRMNRGALGDLGGSLERLARLGAIDRDLAALAAAGHAGSMPIQPATAAYVDRLVALGHSQPALLAAHAYVRYLGDLNGGQALGRIVSQKLGGPIAFYEFGGAAATAALAAEFKQALNRLVPEPDEQAPLIAEAVSAFERHVAIFAELEAARGKPGLSTAPDT